MRRRALWLVLSTIVVVAVTMHFGAGQLNAPGTPEASISPDTKLLIVEDIAAGRRETPIVGEQPRRGLPTLTFFAERHGTDTPRIVSDVTGWGERPDGRFDYSVGKMTRVGETDWYSLEVKVEPYARIEYLIAYSGGDYRLDAHNPRQVQRVGGPASEVVMPGYVPPQEFIDPPTRPAGAISETVIESRAIGGSRRVIVYTPPGYHDGGDYPLAVFHDGGLFVNTGQAPRVLDWLIAHQAIEPIVAVFVDPQSRTDDYRRGAPMRSFVIDELLPWMAEHYSVTKDAGERAIIGVSASGRAAVDTVRSVESFNRLGLLIPALTEADVDAIPQGDRRRIRAAIVAGRYDSLYLAGARMAQITLADRGHTVEFKEVPEGHSTNTWRNHLRDVLISLFSTSR
jgi:enterochelin esterase-like enzyme